VQLWCGDRLLSEADNWYVPSRLTPAMNTALETTDTPFGKAVQELKPYRRTFPLRASVQLGRPTTCATLDNTRTKSLQNLGAA
jgi:hypothetical protein